MKKILIILGAGILVFIVAGASFFGGTAYQKNQASKIQEEFFNGRGGQPALGNFAMPGEQVAPDGEIFGNIPGGGFAGRGLSGEIQALDGDTLLILTADGVITVNLSETTQIIQTIEANMDELSAGTTVTIMGEQQEGGTISATQVQIVDPELIEQVSPQGIEPAP